MASESTVETDRVAGGYSGRILFLVASCSVLSSMGWLAIPPLLPTITDDLAISGTQAGIALTLLAALSALGRFPGGRLADQLSRKTLLAFSLLAWLGGFAILSVATNYPLFLLGVVSVGLGLGAFTPTAFAQLADVFEFKQGLAFGINNAAFNLGGILASGMAVAVLAIGMWRLAFVPVAILIAGMILLLHVWSRESYVIKPVDMEISATATRLFLEPRIRTLLIVAALFSFAWNGSIAFLPTYLEVDHNFSSTLASAAFASVFITGVIATPLSGAIGDRFGSLLAVLMALMFAVAGIALILLVGNTAVVFLGVVVFAIGITGFWPVMTSFMMASFPRGSKGGDYGAIGTVYMGAGSLGPTMAGTVGDRLSYTIAYGIIAAVLILCLALVAWMRRRYVR